jgi:hypothetical protein
LVSSAAKKLVKEFIIDKYKFPPKRVIYYNGVSGIRYYLKNVILADWHWTKSLGIIFLRRLSTSKK